MHISPRVYRMSIQYPLDADVPMVLVVSFWTTHKFKLLHTSGWTYQALYEGIKLKVYDWLQDTEDDEEALLRPIASLLAEEAYKHNAGDIGDFNDIPF